MNEQSFELSIRADGYDDAQLQSLSIIGQKEHELITRLQSSAPILLEGIRGSGKTTLLKLTAVRTRQDGTRAIAAYASFSRYLLLENPRIPVGPAHPFTLWVSTKILGAVYEAAKLVAGENPALPCLAPFLEPRIQTIIDELENTYNLPENVQSPFAALPEATQTALKAFQNPDKLKELILQIMAGFRISSVNLLCDEAAQYFKPEFQPLFFSILKTIFAPNISFKVAIYPTITFFGADFELGHDATVASITRPCLSDEWLRFCEGILAKRSKEQNLWSDNRSIMEALALAAFGIPRRFIELVGSLEISALDELAVLNAIKEHVQRELFQPFDALKARIPSLVREVELANYLRHLFVDDLKQENLNRAYRTAYVAVSLHRALPYALRKANNLLVYLGVLERQAPCKLGNSRETADRLLLNPSLIFSENILADAAKKRLSLGETVERIRELQLDKFKEYGRNSKALQEAVEEARVVDTKPCSQCGTDLPFEARFCNNCGAPQLQTTILSQILMVSSSDLDLTPGIKARVTQKYSTVGEVFRATDEELDSIFFIGPTRVAIIRHAVDEMISG